MTKKPKLISSIRAKLVSAVAMLLVAVIMVVSSTYAWFTLSTAPEVTGISTQIGANGALEMALMPKSGAITDILSYDPADPTEDKNTTWGNLVNLSNGYGLDKIVLYPSALKYTDDKTALAGSLLQGPSYGPDGRLSGYTTAVSGSYSTADGVFYPGASTEYGVQGIGRASGMSTRELMHRDAVSAASSAASAAKKAASDSLGKYGNDLGNLAIEHALAGADEAYDDADLAVVTGIISDMETKVLPALEKAYLYHVLAAATADTNTTDETCTALEKAIKDGATLTTIKTTYAAQYGKLDSKIVKYIEDSTDDDVLRSYNEMLATVTAAEGDLPGQKDSYTWTELSTPLSYMVDLDNVTVNGMTVDEVKADKEALVDLVLNKGGVFITMSTGGGLYADLADHCGDYSTSIDVAVSYNGMDLNMPATMNTATTVTTVYLTDAYGISAALTVVKGSSESNPLTEFYGYVIDLAFRTNATGSNLLLQTTPENRIYEGDAAAETMGAGSTMTFEASEDMTYQQVVALMEAFSLVFFEEGETEGTYDILATAALGEITYNSETGEYTGNVYLRDESGALVKEETNVLKALEANTATALSVLVYLDGTKVENEDVSATSASSLTGKLNLQFSSSAKLVPMEYDGIQATEYEVAFQSALANVTSDGANKATSNSDYTFTLSGLDGLTEGEDYVVGYTVGDSVSLKQLKVGADGKYTIPGNAITGKITIGVVDPESLPTP